MALSRCGHSDPGLQKHGNDGVEIEKKTKWNSEHVAQCWWFHNSNAHTPQVFNILLIHVLCFFTAAKLQAKNCGAPEAVQGARRNGWRRAAANIAWRTWTGRALSRIRFVVMLRGRRFWSRHGQPVGGLHTEAIAAAIFRQPEEHSARESHGLVWIVLIPLAFNIHLIFLLLLYKLFYVDLVFIILLFIYIYCFCQIILI